MINLPEISIIKVKGEPYQTFSVVFLKFKTQNDCDNFLEKQPQAIKMIEEGVLIIEIEK